MRSSQPLSRQIRKAIETSGRTRYSICKELKIPQSTLSRFMSGERGLSMEVLDPLGLLLGLELKPTTRSTPTKEK